MLTSEAIEELEAFDGHGSRVLSVYLDPLHNLVQRAMERALEQAARVEVVRGGAARRLMEAGAGLGALLRPHWSTPQSESMSR